jgi:hypothetical protein
LSWVNFYYFSIRVHPRLLIGVKSWKINIGLHNISDLQKKLFLAPNINSEERYLREILNFVPKLKL